MCCTIRLNCATVLLFPTAANTIKCMKIGNQVVDDMIIPTDKADDNLEVDEIISRHVRLASLFSFGLKSVL